MSFVVCTRGGPRNHLVGGGKAPLQKGDFKYCSNLLLLLLYIITLHCLHGKDMAYCYRRCLSVSVSVSHES